MEIYRPGAQIEVHAQNRLNTLDGRVREIELEKERIEGIVKDYGILLGNPIWPAVVDWARQLPSAYLAFANPQSPEIERAAIVLAWGFKKSDIYPGHESWQQSLPRKKSLTWSEVGYWLIREEGVEAPAVVLNGEPVDLSTQTASAAVESALRRQRHRGGWGDRELRRGENIRTSTFWKRIPIEQLG